MTKNKKIALTAAGAMLVSLFLPFAKLGFISISIFDAVTNGAESTELIGVSILVIAFAVLTYFDKSLIARICSLLVLLACLYGAYKLADTQSSLGDFGMDVNMFNILGIGAYVLLLGSIAGVIFSKSDSK